MHNPLIGLLTLLLISGAQQLRQRRPSSTGLQLLPRPMPVAE